MLGRVSINTRTRLGTSLLALLQVKIIHYIGLSMQRKIALYVSFFKLCYENYTIFYCEPEPELYKPVLKYFCWSELKPNRFNLSEP